VTRRAALLLIPLLATAASAEPAVTLLDGRRFPGAKVVSADATTARLALPDGEWTVPCRNLAVAELADAPDTAPRGPKNLYLHNGDAVRGTVRGQGATVALEGPGVAGLVVPLDVVKAVRYGRLLGAAQESYDTVFLALVEAGRNSVLAQRDARPFPIDARVIEAFEATMKVRIGAAEHDLPDPQKVYGFVLAEERDPPGPPPGVAARLHLADGGRLTLPLERLDEENFSGGGATVARARIVRIEFLGAHVVGLDAIPPIDVKETAAFGEAPRFRTGAMVHGGPLRLAGHEFASGIGAHAYSRLEFPIGRRWRQLHTLCGIDDAAGPRGEALFRVLGDGKVLAEERRRRGEPPARLLIDVAGVERLVLEAEPLDSYASDFCDWADARVFNAEKMGEPPAGAR